MSLNQILTKVGYEVRWSSGNTNAPEPEELKEIVVNAPRVSTNSSLHSIKAKLQRRGGNRTFHKYAGDLWSIEANKVGRCASCSGKIMPGQEITLFQGVQGWCHFIHAVDQPTPDRRLEPPQMIPWLEIC